jgi:hypothetical protein
VEAFEIAPAGGGLVSVLVSVGFSICFAGVRGAARSDSVRTVVNTGDLRCAALACSAVPQGLVGINSAVSYRLDHAPSGAPLYPSAPTCEVETA